MFLLTLGAAIWLMMNVRKAAALGWEFEGAPKNVIAAGLVMWAVLMEALRRTGGWSLLLSVLPFTVYPMFADSNGSGRSAARNRPSSRPPPITCCRARACSAFRFRPSPTP